MTDPTRSDAALAAAIAEEAGQFLLALQRRGALTGAALGDAGDREANALILARLAEARPGDPILSEESVDAGARHGARRLWIVDPLDGTREFAAGRDDWAVHVGLSIDGIAEAGAVAVPARGLLLRSDEPPPLKREASPLRLTTSRSRPAPVARQVAEALSALLLPMGSAGAKTAAVLMGEADAYLHSGAQHEWDNCAPAAVARAAGLHVSRLGGEPLRYNRANTLVPDLLICHRARAAELIRLAASVSRAPPA